MATTGTATVDFGSVYKNAASVDVTGQTGILSNSIVEAWLSPATTADHTVDEHEIASATLKVVAGPPVSGDGFTIYAVTTTPGGVSGKWNVEWVWYDVGGPVTVATVLGSTLVEWFFQQHTGGSVWTGEVAGKTFEQSDAARQPTPATTPGGVFAFSFDGAATPNDDQMVVASAIGDGGIGAGTGYFLWACIVKCNTLVTAPDHGVLRISTTGEQWGFTEFTTPGAWYMLTQLSDASIQDLGWHRIIGVTNETLQTTILYVDGVVQSGFSSDPNTSMRDAFVDALLQLSVTGNEMNSTIGSVVFASSASNFDAATVAQLDAVLLRYITTGP